MTARLLDGKALAATIRAEVAGAVAEFRAQYDRPPCLAVVLAGEDPASISYVTAKGRACAEVGILSRQINLPETASATEILDTVRALNADDTVDGILVQLPLPDTSIENEVIEAIDPAKDVDGFHPVNAGRLSLGMRALAPCTPCGIVEMLKRAEVPLRGAEVVIFGRSRIVGRPLSILLSQKGVDATVTLCHTRTKDPAAHTRHADVVIVATGHPHTLTADMVKPGAVVVDVGVNRIPDSTRKSGYRLVGDADFDDLLPKVAAITPVPGGVGPMTIAMLLRNTLQAAQWRMK